MKKLILVTLTVLTMSSYLFSTVLSDKIQNATLVVYGSNLGLVHEERDLSLNTADRQIIYEDVAPTLQTDSINVELSSNVTLYSQQYRFDSLTQKKLLQAHIGKKVEIRLLKNKNEFHIITATLLAYNGETSLVRTLSYKIITVKSDAIMFENVPDTLVTKPSLIWNIKTHKDTTTKMKLDYLISGISFQSNYVLHINNNNANFTGWISINNRSGKKFKNVKLSLLTGTIQRKEKSFEGYYFYTIPFPVTLQNNETTQIKFIQDNNISIQRLYSVTLTNPLYLQGQQKYDVSQFIFFKGLHKPLIKGAIRIYTKQDQTILLSENSIQQTPKHKDIKLKTGTNFDLKATQTLIKRSDSNEWINVDIEYMLTNNSDTNKTIEVLVPFNTDDNSKVRTDETYSFTKGNLVTFIVNINANSIKKFNVNYESKK